MASVEGKSVSDRHCGCSLQKAPGRETRATQTLLQKMRSSLVSENQSSLILLPLGTLALLRGHCVSF